MRVLAYWAARLGIFVAIAAFLWWVVKWQDLISLIAAFILGWLVSYLVLPGMRRDAASRCSPAGVIASLFLTRAKSCRPSRSSSSAS